MPSLPCPGGLARATALLLAALLAAGSPRATTAQEPPAPDPAPPYTKEYQNLQPAHTTLVFRFDSFESEFESRISEAGHAPFRVSGVAGLRIGPMFQFVEAVPTPRQLVIEVALGRRSGRARIDMQLIRFEPTGPEQEQQQNAWRLLSHGLEAAPPDRLDQWQTKVMSLKQAALLFDGLGMQEPMLWAEFYASHFLLERLGDALSAVEGARMIETGATRVRQPRIRLAALQLEGRALLALAGGGSDRATYDRARAVLGEAAALAAELDFQYERALALFQIGLAYEHESRHREAFAQYDEALAVAMRSEDVDFANALRRHAAGLHERLGNTTAAIALMQQIDTGTNAAPATAAEEVDAAEGTDGRSRRDNVRYLYEQSRLLVKSFRYDEAIDVLEQALALDRSTPGSRLGGPAGLLLGKALFHAGHFDEAARQLIEAMPQTPASAHAGELRESWEILGAIWRSRGETDAVAAAREQQTKFVTTQEEEARLSYERGVDALANGGAARAGARQYFGDAIRLAGDLPGLAERARLQLCALADPARQAGDYCRDAGAPSPSGTPAEALEARWLWTRMLQRRSRNSEAAAVIEGLIEELLFYRSELPGVLGAWYWLQRDAIFDAFVRLQLRHDAASGSGALRTLAALDALRESGTNRKRSQARQDADTDRLRSLLGARTGGAAPQVPAREAEIRALIQRVRNGAQWTDLAKPAGQLQARLDRLTSRESLLAYYVTDERAYAWFGRSGRLQLLALPWDAASTAMLTEAGALLRDDGARDPAALDAMFEQMGAALLDPVGGGLGDDILFLPAGLLEGLPVDALKWRGRHLAATHRVTNLRSVAGLDHAGPVLDGGAEFPVFLAGNRQEGAGDFTIVTPPSSELRTVADRFVGPGLTLIQGAALQWHEFQDERFQQALLLHLAMPAVENLRNAADAHWLMSDNAEDPERVWLRGADVPSPLQARLAVLSNCAYTAADISPLGRRGGLVDSLLHAGADAVITSFWRVGDAPAADFMRRFYARLAEDPDIAGALADTKRDDMAAGPTGLPVWAAFQLFID